MLRRLFWVLIGVGIGYAIASRSRGRKSEDVFAVAPSGARSMLSEQGRRIVDLASARGAGVLHRVRGDLQRRIAAGADQL